MKNVPDRETDNKRVSLKHHMELITSIYVNSFTGHAVGTVGEPRKHFTVRAELLMGAATAA